MANDAAASIERLSSQSSNLSELRAEYDRLKQAKTEAYLSGDDRKAFDVDGQLRQIGFQINKIKSVNAEIEAQKKAAESLSSTYTQTYNQIKQSLAEGAEDVSDYIQLIESQKKVVADLTSKYQQLKAAKAPTSQTSALLNELNQEKGASCHA